MEETPQSKLTSLESVAAVVQSQDITDEDREDSSVQPFGALTPQSSTAWPEIPRRRARKRPKLRVPRGSRLCAKRIARKRMSMRFRSRGFRLFSSFSLPCRGRSATRCRAHRYRDKGPKVCTKSRAKIKRPQDRNAAKVATRLRKKFGRRREIARGTRLSLLTGFYSMRLNHQENRRRVAHGSRNRSEDELMRNHQDSKRETAEEHVDADEHRRRTECSKVCTKKRAKGRKRPKDRNATKVATRLRKKFKSRREIARQVRLLSGTGFYRMRPYRRKKKKREAHDSRKESAGKGTSRCSFRRASDQVRDRRRPSSRKKKKREAHDSRKGSVGKRTPRCSFRGTLKQVRHREVGDLREVAGGDKEKSATGKVVRLDEGVINFHAYRTPRLTRKAFWARPPRKRDKPTLKADTVPRIFEGLPSYLTKRKPRSRSSTVRPPCKRPRESACEELRASPTPCLDRTVVRVVRKRPARKGPTGSVTARRSPAKCCTARSCRLDENKSCRLYARVKAKHYYNE
ncbi:hypothetical protein HPB52_002598 [Rhipicephalus sanguineus]|uniref:Uncharacterized protein n=1 Tax=Rhipicephalus sanguineus TaxID=34632 RepID=A0A9D4T782_RHISA|nr:hypothetical protein HPB52_002598 [Rhipicephalus sanguineus]